MILLELKTLPLEDTNAALDYRDVLIHTLKTHPQGMQLDEMERVLRIVNIIRQARGRVALEDADHEYIVRRLTTTLWQRADPALVQFIKDVRDAPPFDVNEALN